MSRRNNPETFWRRIDRSGGPAACWPWTGYRLKKGYGVVSWDGRPTYAHRIAWVLTNGALAEPGLCVLHRCDDPPCCNPAHLFLGTKADNNSDMMAKGRGRWPKGDHVPPEARARGERCGSAKHTARDVVLIRKLLAAGHSQRDVAELTGVPRGTVSGIALGRYWKHVPEPGELVEAGA